MDPFLQFLTWQFVLFCMFVFAVTSVIRNFVEFFYKDAKNNKLWTTLILTTMPIMLGGCMGFFLKGPYPDGITNKDSQVVYGVVAGLLCGTLYRVLKGMIKAKLENPEEAEDELLESIRGSINEVPLTPVADPNTTIITTTTTSVPVVDGQPVAPVPAPVAVIPGVQATEVVGASETTNASDKPAQ